MLEVREDGAETMISRRQFFGLAGGFAASSLLPGTVLELGPAAVVEAPKVWIDPGVVHLMRDGVYQNDAKISHEIEPMILNGFGYWVVDAHSGNYAGIDRSFPFPGHQTRSKNRK